MKSHLLLILLGTGLLCSACAQSDKQEIPLGHSSDMTFTCSIGEPQTRAFIFENGTHVYWSTDDSIKIFKGESISGKFFNQSASASQNASFKGTLPATMESWSDDDFCGVYPYSESAQYSEEGVSLTVPALQTAVDGSFDASAFPMMGKSANASLSFYNICGGLRFKVANAGITSISFEGNKGECIAGDVIVNFDAQGHPSVVRTVNGASKVTLECEPSFTPGTWYYLSMLPAQLDEGFKITLTRGVDTKTFLSSRSSSVKRAVFGELEKLDKGLSFDFDIRTDEFIHHSLLLCFPNCDFSGSTTAEPSALISSSKIQTSGNLEVAVMLANGPEGINDAARLLITQLNKNTVPFHITDYRISTTTATDAYRAYLGTPNLYGTVSGIALDTKFDGNNLTINASYHLKEADDYKIVVLITQEGSSYPFTYMGGQYLGSVQTDYRVRYCATDVLGEQMSVLDPFSTAYRTFTVKVSDDLDKDRLRVLSYVLRPYGSREAVMDGNYGTYYVDNAVSVRAGESVGLSTQVDIDSEISSFYDGGTIEF